MTNGNLDKGRKTEIPFKQIVKIWSIDSCQDFLHTKLSKCWPNSFSEVKRFSQEVVRWLIRLLWLFFLNAETPLGMILGVFMYASVLGCYYYAKSAASVGKRPHWEELMKGEPQFKIEPRLKEKKTLRWSPTLHLFIQWLFMGYVQCATYHARL